MRQEDRVTGPREGGAGGGSSKRAVVLAVAGPLLALDVLTKGWIRGRFDPGESVAVLGEWMRLTYVLNPGAAFGLHVGPYSRQLFVVLAVLALVVIVWVVRGTPADDRPRLAALALVLGGALGNLLDRLRPHGSVVDFLDVGWGPAVRWPVFNVADVGVTLGALLLVALLWSEETRGEGSTAPSARSPGRGATGAPPEPAG